MPRLSDGSAALDHMHEFIRAPDLHPQTRGDSSRLEAYRGCSCATPRVFYPVKVAVSQQGPNKTFRIKPNAKHRNMPLITSVVRAGGMVGRITDARIMTS